MKQRPLLVLVPVISVLIATLSIMASRKAVREPSGFALVQLFTSEGCSSCPAAEEALAKMAAAFPSHVYVLELHVDYWDRLGWKDAFSSSEYTGMQRDYAKSLNLRSIYTPQAVVNGQVELVGSEEGRLRAAIEAGLKQPAGNAIELHVAGDGKTVQVNYKVPDAGKEMLNIALVQSHAETQVGAGENSGHLLKHSNIVRAIKSQAVHAGSSGSVTLSLPRGLTEKDCKVIAWLQDTAVTGAASADISTAPSSPQHALGR
ncbi:MAG: DUF1223 domain-containing protein [Bacteroidota bacterium]|nr:DUF1223 domain-containing protein [Bacteroidota bacterium]